MRRGRAVLAAVALLALGLCGSGLAQSRAQRLRQTAVQMHFTHWVLYANKSGASVKQTVPPGGTFRICSSSKLTRLDAHYRATGANNLSVSTKWKVTSQPAISEPGRLYPSGFFYITSPHGMPDGTWSISVARHGTTLGKSSVKVVKEHC